MRIPRAAIGIGLLLLIAYGAYASYVTYSPGEDRAVTLVAGTAKDGTMFFHCDQDGSTPGVCEDVDGHARVTVDRRDRVAMTVRTDDGRKHPHDFFLEGAPYFVFPAGIEMELEKPSETKSFTAYARGEYRFVCELAGHEEAGMWGTLVVR